MLVNGYCRTPNSQELHINMYIFRIQLEKKSLTAEFTYLKEIGIYKKNTTLRDNKLTQNLALSSMFKPNWK